MKTGLSRVLCALVLTFSALNAAHASVTVDTAPGNQLYGNNIMLAGMELNSALGFPQAVNYNGWSGSSSLASDTVAYGAPRWHEAVMSEGPNALRNYGLLLGLLLIQLLRVSVFGGSQSRP